MSLESNMKMLLIGCYALLLTSCSWFTDTPQTIVNGQRAVYQSVLIGEENAMKLIDKYIIDCRKAVTYHLNYVFQSKLNENNSNPDWDQEVKLLWNAQAEDERDTKLEKSYALIDKRADDMRRQVLKHYNVSLRLVAAVYNYLSTTPLQADNVEFWIKRLNKMMEGTK